jgi:SAM-dependent methyltransferase
MTEKENPWDWLQAHDSGRLGDVINDPRERSRWCNAILMGGLPYLWRHKAGPVRELMYQQLALKPTEKVLVLGESLASCGFVADIRQHVGPHGEIRAIDIIEDARDAVTSGRRGRNGKLGTWRYDYTREIPDAHFDCIAVLQGIQHTDDWRESGRELLRILKPGRVLMLAESGFSPKLRMLAELDLHIEYWLDKLFFGAGMQGLDFSYYSKDELLEAFDGLLHQPQWFEWRGIELFWGSKP